MIEVINKSDQFNDSIFGGRFLANKPVFNGHGKTLPYSCLYYWSNGYVLEDCEFGLHPHQGFEIMTFLFEGSIEHYDTTTNVWTPLHAGDFQIIQSNSGIRHQERIKKGARAFQIWFDPNYKHALNLPPSYIDYHAEDFKPVQKEGYDELVFIGPGSAAHAMTADITIKKLIFYEQQKIVLALNDKMSYTFYILYGSGKVAGNGVQKDDAIRITGTDEVSVDVKGELFIISSPTSLEYTPVWE
jgi:redox-sensitive bicupin YhaK (pirin superfamily)